MGVSQVPGESQGQHIIFESFHKVGKKCLGEESCMFTLFMGPDHPW